MPSESGALPPKEAAQAVLQNAVEHLEEPIITNFVTNVCGALLLSSGGLLSVTLSCGFPELAENNPGVQRLLQGAAFPLGLVLVYFAGAELFTGYPMWHAMAALSRKGRPSQYLQSAIASWIGNLLGSLLSSTLFTVATRSLSAEPWRSGITAQITDDIVELPWHVIFVRAIGCGWLVTVAMYLGTQNQDGISKALCLQFPFMISATLRWPHTVEYMYLASTGMLLGAPLSIGGFFWKCLLPITLGNILGGGIFTGAYLWWTYLKGENEDKGDERRQERNGYLIDSD